MHLESQPPSRARHAPAGRLRVALVALLVLRGIAALPGASRAAAPPDSTTSAASTSEPGELAPPAAAASSALPAPRLAGYLQAREIAQEQAGFTTVLNRVRFSIDGSLPSRFSYRVLTEWQAATGARTPATVGLREAIVRWSPAPFTLTAGEFKTPFTREYLIPVPDLELADLATAIDSIAPRYDVGLMAEYALGATATFSAGVFNGEGANTTANRDSVAMFVGRVAARPLAQLGLGASVTRDGADSLRWGVDASAQHWGAVVRAEYLTRHRRGRERAKDDFGWYVFEACRVTPRVQLVARQEDFQRPERGVSRRVRGAAWGANYEIAPNRVRLLLELSQRVSGAKQVRSDLYLAQVQARF